jgi:hypothetical protein
MKNIDGRQNRKGRWQAAEGPLGTLRRLPLELLGTMRVNLNIVKIGDYRRV